MRLLFTDAWKSSKKVAGRVGLAVIPSKRGALFSLRRSNDWEEGGVEVNLNSGILIGCVPPVFLPEGELEARFDITKPGAALEVREC
jgi:hypothetical protein